MRRVLVFDSGLGGLSVARELAALGAGRLSIDYVADSGGFPYGDWPEDELRRRLVELMGRVAGRLSPDVVVIACNTASVVALAALRAAVDVPFVGTVPAIKPAARITRSGIIGVLATPSTVRREYTAALIHTYAYHCRVILHGAEKLAAMAEARLLGEGLDMRALKEEIAPAFASEGDRRTDAVVLGCTHYPLIKNEIAEAAPWPVELIDPSPAIARRALEVALACPEREGAEKAGTAFVTSPEGLTGARRDLFRREGFAGLEVIG